MKVIKLDFGEVEIGKTAVKTIDIWNESYVSVCSVSNCRTKANFFSAKLIGETKVYSNLRILSLPFFSTTFMEIKTCS